MEGGRVRLLILPVCVCLSTYLSVYLTIKFISLSISIISIDLSVCEPRWLSLPSLSSSFSPSSFLPPFSLPPSTIHSRAKLLVADNGVLSARRMLSARDAMIKRLKTALFSYLALRTSCGAIVCVCVWEKERGRDGGRCRGGE